MVTHGIDEVAIVGAGWMGSGIATICALGGHPVNLVDVSSDILDRCATKVRSNLDVLVTAKEISSAAADRAMGRVRKAASMADGLSTADLAIEAVPERLELKQDVFVSMEAASRPSTILATNASGIPTSEIAARCEQPERTVGFHVFEPPFVLRAVEVIRGEHTSDDTFERTVAFVESIGSVPIRVLKDRRAFVINYFQQVARKAAVELLEAGVTTEEDILRAARFSFGVKFVTMGPYLHIRGGVERESQYEPEWFDEMGRRAQDMLPLIRYARALEDLESHREPATPPTP
jgi:3-hydroxyacyl-CoA dehydrogenase